MMLKHESQLMRDAFTEILKEELFDVIQSKLKQANDKNIEDSEYRKEVQVCLEARRISSKCFEKLIQRMEAK